MRTICYVLVFLIGLAFMAAGASIALSADLDKMRDQALSLTAQLNGNCSATLIYSERDEATGEVTTVFLTAKHCVTNDKAVQYLDLPIYQKGRVVKRDRYTAKVRGKHFQHDLALVELIDRQTWFPVKAKVAPVDAIPAMGAPVITVGYPLGMQLTVTSGLFGSLETIDYPQTGTEYYRATPDLVGGNSGGAMYRVTAAGDYELIGVSSAGHRMFSFVGLYVPLEPIHEYLKVAMPTVVGDTK